MNLYTYPLTPVIGIDPLGLCRGSLFNRGWNISIFPFRYWFNDSNSESQQVDIDQYGHKVNPEADILTSENKSGLNSGGNCTPQDLNDLQNEKNRLCNQSRTCSPQMPKNELLRRYDMNLACALARKN